jgi:cell division protein FtsI (penicillin-binding protein 3)
VFTGNSKPRLVIGRLVMIVALVFVGIKLIDIQGVEAPELASKAQQQSITPMVIPAQRGTVTDRDGTDLAFNVDIRALTAQPKTMRGQWDDPAAGDHDGITYDQHTQAIADEMHRLIGNSLDEQTVLNQLRSDATFVYLDKSVDPAVATQLTSDFPEIGTEVRSAREYPDGNVGANVIGLANWRTDPGITPGVHGVFGLEHSMDKQLAGQPGREVANTEQGNDSVVIPNSQRVLQAAVPGADVQLTIDADVQYEVQQELAQYVHKTGAKMGSAVVLDAHTGEVYALANDATFDPNDPSGTITDTNVGDPAVTTPFEPGSVNKVVTAAAVIDDKVATPTSVIDVPPVFQNGDKQVRDDWIHPDWKMTVTGVFAKSSNIGTDELAKMVGPQRYDQMLQKMGLGQPTGIGLPGESPGYVPPMSKWSGSTFGNLPIGQGLSMTVVQMAGMYQTIANNGLRVPPRIIKAVTRPDGTVVPTKQPAGVRVISTQSAETVRMMMRAVTQKGHYPQDATAPSAALPGYQISGKTGTGQQIDPKCGCYSHTKNTVTFAGILSADNPRFVVGVMLDAPNGDLEGGETAAPLFHDIASYLAQKYDLPVSDGPTPFMTLVAKA